MRFLTVIDANRAAPGGAPRHPGNAHRRERTPHYSLGRRDEAVYAGDREPLSKFECTKADDPGHQQDSESLRQSHFLPPTAKIFGNSSMSERSFISTFLALVAFLKAKSSDPTSAPLFQSLIVMLYSGACATLLLVMT